MRKTTVFALAVALALAASASAAPPVPRLVYTKAVAYVTAQGKAHGVKVACAPYDAKNGLYGNAACTIGKMQLKMMGGPKCHLFATLFQGPPDFVHPVQGGGAYLTLCRAGWQKELPLPWTVAA